jgi:hypothetical protein
LRRGWTRFSVCVSLFAGTVLSVQAPKNLPAAVSPRRASELRLAGLQPGADFLSRAKRLCRQPELMSDDGNTATWTDNCRKIAMYLDLESTQRVRTVRVSAANWLVGDCGPVHRSKWRTARDLALGDPSARVVQLYGEPDSRSPSTKDGQRLELMYYAFDWAGPDVPQVMEVLCTLEKDGNPGRVVEITLAAASL